MDKVVLYALGCMPSLYQYKEESQGLVGKIVRKVGEMKEMFDDVSRRGSEGVCEQVEKYLEGVLEQLGRLQNYFPFVYAPFLNDYLYLLLALLIQGLPRINHFRREKLLSVIVTANLKPLTSFAYYQTS